MRYAWCGASKWAPSSNLQVYQQSNTVSNKATRVGTA
jgi:hypothetical protein